MQITDKDIQTFRKRAKTELQSNGAVGRLAWDSVVDALCNEVEELRKNAAPGNAAAMRATLLSAARTMEIESLFSCTEKGELGKFGNTLSELCKGCRARNCECWQMTLKREVESALSAPARNCDICRTLEDADYAYANRETTGLRFSSNADFEAWLFAPAEGGDHA